MSLIETAIGIAAPGAGVPLKIMGGIKSGATYLFAHPMTAIALLAGVFGAVEHHEAGKWARVANQRGNALSAVKSANDAAIKSATIAKESKDAQNAKLAIDADRSAADLGSRYHAIVMQLAAAQYSARRANLPGYAQGATGGNGPGEGSDIPIGPVAIPGGDALICADNTARLQAVHDWAIGIGDAP